MFTVLYFQITILVSDIVAAPGIIKLRESTVTSNALSLVFDYYYLNGLSFQQDAVITFNGWQYVAFYNSSRHVTLARRQISDENWQVMSLSDYTQRINDSHNIISMGIAPNDGTIHLAFDHHSVSLHYRRSITGLATHPENFSWSDSLFGSTTYRLVTGQTVYQVTYPRFVSTPQGDLQFEARIGTSGDGQSYLWEYSAVIGEWISLGKFVDNPIGGNAYLNGLHYDNNGVLHTSWVKRQTPDASTNHDLYYIYSEDNGRTWCDNSGSVIGTTGSDPVTIEEPKVWTIPVSNGLINQEAQTIDHEGRIHLFMRRNVSGKNYQFHYWRDIDGTWHETNTGIATKIWYQRSKILVDEDNNAYAIMPDLVIASASRASNWTDWTVINNDDERRFYSEPLYDWYRLYKGDGILSVLYQERNSGNLMLLDYQLNMPSVVKTDKNSTLNNGFYVEQNHPNPFNPITTIQFGIPTSAHVKITVYNLQGQVITTLLDQNFTQGSHIINFTGKGLVSGLYFYKFESADFTQLRKMILIK